MEIDLPGPGYDCPIVVGEHVYLMCWIGFGVERNKPGDQSDLRLHLLRIDGKDCKTFWFEAVEPSIPEEEYRGMFTQHGYATHTLVSSGKRIFTFFGKSGVVAFDLKGKRLWQTSVGKELDC